MTTPPSHIPDWLGDLCCAPDGTVFTAGYAESGGGGASYKNGLFSGRYDGFQTGFGSPVNAVAADAKWVYFGGNNGVERYPHGGGTAPNLSVLPRTFISGLTLWHGLLYASDFTNNLIRVFSPQNLTQVNSWPAARPWKLAVDDSGRVWVIQLGLGTDTGN